MTDTIAPPTTYTWAVYADEYSPEPRRLVDQGVSLAGSLLDAAAYVATECDRAGLTATRVEAVSVGLGRKHITVWVDGGDA